MTTATATSERSEQDPRSGSLGLHGESWTGGRLEDPRKGGCERWPERVYLRNLATGDLVPGRCKAVNLCDYCAKLQAVENTHLLQLDAMYGEPANIISIFGTRTATMDLSGFYTARKLVRQHLRREWPDARYSALLEFTTGYGPRSGGKRRPHWNQLWKGIPTGDLDAAGAIMREVWCRNVDALPEHQYVAPVQSVGGLTRYIAQHFTKQSQAPPPGFRGHRFTASRGFLWLPTPEARAVTRESLQRERYRWKIERQCPDLDACTVDEIVDQLMALRAAQTWDRVDLRTATDRPAPTFTGTDPAERVEFLRLVRAMTSLLPEVVTR